MSTPEATFKAAAHKAITQMWADIPAYQFRVAADIKRAEDKCVETLTVAARRAFAQGALFDAEDAA